MGFWQQLTGQEGGSIIPGVDNPFHNSQTTWLPGLGAANPLNSQSVVGQAVKDLGSLNIFNPDSTAGKVTNNIVKDIGKDPVKWAAVAVAIAAGQPQLIPSIMSVAKLTSKKSSPEEWIVEGIKAAAIKYGGDWVAKNVAGASGYVGSTDAGQDWIPGTGVAGATGSATAAKVAANAARGMFVAAAQKGDTNIKGEQIITSAITNEGLNQAMAEIPGWDTLSKSEQSTAVNAFKVAFNKDESAAYNLFNQGFDKVVKEAEREAAKLGYNTLENQVKVNDLVYSRGTAEDRTLLNKLETDYKTARTRQAELSDAWHNAMGDPVAQGKIDNELSEMADIQNRTIRNFNEFSADLSSRPAGLHDDFDTTTGATGTDTVAGGTQDVTQDLTNAGLAEGTKIFGVGDVFGTGEQITLYADGRVKDSNDAAPRALTAEEAASINPTFPGAVAAKEPDVVKDLTNAGLHDDFDTADLTKVVGGTDTLTGGTGTDTLTGGTGTDTTTGTIDNETATGDTTKPLDGASAYKYDPVKKTYTYTSDDGSTLTLDESGTPIGFTEATDTSWAGLTDTATGNLKLPKLPGGFAPTVKPPAKKITDTTKTTTTGTGTTTTTTNTGTKTTGTGTKTTGTGASSVDSILNLLEGAEGDGGQQVPYTPAQIPVADIKSYYNTIRGIAGERLLPESKEEKDNSGIDGLFAEGGTVDDLLRILRG